jgi:rhodanese-related sulfurtransferase
MAAVAATEIGYRNVDVFIGGYPAWAARGYPIESDQ